jgi:3',5'-cyclic AMP phosphodiesterase CpdA
MASQSLRHGVVALLLLLAACGGGEPSDETTTTTTTSTTTTTTVTSASTTAKPPEERLVLTATGDIGATETGRATLEAMAAVHPDAHLALGDLSYQRTGTEQTWCDLVHAAVGDDPFEIVSGNHEADGSGTGRIATFEACLPDRLGAHGVYGREYYLDVGRLVRVILISPSLRIEGERYDYTRGTAHRRWLEQAIDGARAAGIAWVVVGMHKPCLTVGAYRCDVSDDLFSFLVAKKVDLVLTGHDHTYQRSKQLALSSQCPAIAAGSYAPACVVDDGADGRYAKGAGLVDVTVGAGGAGLYRVHDGDSEARYFAVTMGANDHPAHGFAVLELSATQLTLRFVASTGGPFADRFVMTG